MADNFLDKKFEEHKARANSAVTARKQSGLNGLLLKNVGAKLYVDNELVQEEFGELGFSERGIEGAVALRLSRDAVDALIEDKK